MASLAISLLALPDAHAGSYIVTYSGGSFSTTGSNTSGGVNTSGRDFVSSGAATAESGSTCSINIDTTSPAAATLTWQPAAGQTLLTDPPPPAAITEQRCTASAGETATDGDASWTATVDCGLPGAQPTSSATEKDSYATYYAAQPAPSGSSTLSSFGLTCPASATFSGTGGSQTRMAITGSASVDYGVTAYPITISIGGTTLVNGTPEVLTGQPITVSLNPLPSGCSASNYQWDIESAEGGSLCGNYISKQAEGMVVYPALTNPTVTFYDGIQDTMTVNLTVTITFPDNTTGKATATAMVMVVKPTLLKPSFSLVGGNNFSQDPNDTSSQYGAVETYNNLQIIMPLGFTGGTGYVVQKVQSTSRVDMRHTGSNYTQQQKQFGSWMPIPAPCLDGDFPYPFASIWAATPNGATPTQNQTGSGIDTPTVFCAPPLISGDTEGMDWYASTGNDQFMVWIMYNPDPSSSSDIWVPLNTFTWGWSNQASLNATTNTWSAPNFQPASGSNSPIPSGEWPMWTTWVQYSGTGYLAMRP